MANHLWPPFTQMKGLKPVIMERAEGALVWDSDGNEYIDAFASLWTVNVGHGRAEIHDAIKAQMERLSIYHIFQIANEPAVKLANKVAQLAPGDLDHVFLRSEAGSPWRPPSRWRGSTGATRARAPSTWSCSATAPTTARP
jgi:adenosylmethionine-8-amino-7-oxononanoate aminotransferase